MTLKYFLFFFSSNRIRRIEAKPGMNFDIEIHARFTFNDMLRQARENYNDCEFILKERPGRDLG